MVNRVWPAWRMPFACRVGHRLLQSMLERPPTLEEGKTLFILRELYGLASAGGTRSRRRTKISNENGQRKNREYHTGQENERHLPAMDCVHSIVQGKQALTSSLPQQQLTALPTISHQKLVDRLSLRNKVPRAGNERASRTAL